MNRKLMMAAMMAATMAEIFPAPRTYSNMARAKTDIPTWTPPTPPRGSTQADAEALAKAEAKRQRRAAKRRAEVGGGDTAIERPNV
jgi:hypothetical protein